MARKTKQNLLLTFIDMEKAYDNVARDILWPDLLHMLAPEDQGILADILKMYEGLQASVIGGTGQNISITKGVKQGCPCSPLIFGMFFEQIETWVNEAVNTFIEQDRVNKRHFLWKGRTRIDMLMFADDIIILTRTVHGANVILAAMHDFCRTKGFKMNMGKGKTECIVMDRNGQLYSQPTTGNGITIPTTTRYKYLGVLIDGTGQDKANNEHTI